MLYTHTCIYTGTLNYIVSSVYIVNIMPPQVRLEK